MKIIQLNATCGIGSTGKICVAISELLTSVGIENYILYSEESSGYSLGIKYEGVIYRKFQALFSRVLGNNGLNCLCSTYNLIRKIEKISPDIVHIHNIHSHDVNYVMLLKYLKKKNIRIFWTFHDCWAFTGYCYHFIFAGCDKWKRECSNCPQWKKFSWFKDRSEFLFRKKASEIEDANISVITPSIWLAEETGSSIFRNCSINVINNGIDLTTFKKQISLSLIKDFRKKGIKIVLAVVNGYDICKGVDTINLLPDLLPTNYRVVVVGLNDSKKMDNRIKVFPRTNSKRELAEYYSMADVFINPTREDTFPTTNIEALACGTPVVTFKVGGSAEIIDEETGIAVERGNIKKFVEAICAINKTEELSQKCRLRAVELYDENQVYLKYLELYLRGELSNV